MDPVATVGDLPQTDVDQPLGQSSNVADREQPAQLGGGDHPICQLTRAVAEPADVEPSRERTRLYDLRVFGELVIQLDPRHDQLADRHATARAAASRGDGLPGLVVADRDVVEGGRVRVVFLRAEPQIDARRAYLLSVSR